MDSRISYRKICYSFRDIADFLIQPNHIQNWSIWNSDKRWEARIVYGF